jgi:hypothetical protein
VAVGDESETRDEADGSTLCAADDSEETIADSEESTEEEEEGAAVVSREKLLKANPLELWVRDEYLGFEVDR